MFHGNYISIVLGGTQWFNSMLWLSGGSAFNVESVNQMIHLLYCWLISVLNAL